MCHSAAEQNCPQHNTVFRLLSHSSKCNMFEMSFATVYPVQLQQLLHEAYCHLLRCHTQCTLICLDATGNRQVVCAKVQNRFESYVLTRALGNGFLNDCQIQSCCLCNEISQPLMKSQQASEPQCSLRTEGRKWIFRGHRQKGAFKAGRQ